MAEDVLASELSSLSLAELLCAVEVVVPDGISPGETFTVYTAWGGAYDVACPHSAFAGHTISINLPAGPDTDAELISRVTSYLEDDDSRLMQQVEAFAVANAHRVTDMPRVTSEAMGEFSLETQGVHAEYVELVEKLLEELLLSLGLSAADFAAIVRRAGADAASAGGAVMRLIDGLTDFDVFVQMMEDTRFS